MALCLLKNGGSDGEASRLDPHCSLELLIGPQSEFLTLLNVRQSLVIIFKLGFTESEKCSRSSKAWCQFDALAKRVARFGIALSLVQACAKIKPPFGPCRTQRERLFIKTRGLSRLRVEQRLGTSGQVFELVERADLRTTRLMHSQEQTKGQRDTDNRTMRKGERHRGS